MTMSRENWVGREKTNQNCHQVCPTEGLNPRREGEGKNEGAGRDGYVLKKG